MVDEPSRNKEVYRVQFTIEGLPKLILSKPIVAGKRNYTTLL
jgi:hypothetical protein